MQLKAEVLRGRAIKRHNGVALKAWLGLFQTAASAG